MNATVVAANMATLRRIANGPSFADALDEAKEAYLDAVFGGSRLPGELAALAPVLAGGER